MCCSVFTNGPSTNVYSKANSLPACRPERQRALRGPNCALHRLARQPALGTFPYCIKEAGAPISTINNTKRSAERLTIQSLSLIHTLLSSCSVHRRTVKARKSFTSYPLRGRRGALFSRSQKRLLKRTARREMKGNSSFTTIDGCLASSYILTLHCNLLDRSFDSETKRADTK